MLRSGRQLPDLDRRCRTGLHRIAGGQALRRDDVATLAVGEQHQGNVRRAVGIVLDTLNAGRMPSLLRLKSTSGNAACARRQRAAW
jgi:hypothetical protein